MKKLIASLMVGLLLLCAVGTSSALNENRGGLMGFIAGCCFGIRAGAAYNDYGKKKPPMGLSAHSAGNTPARRTFEPMTFSACAGGPVRYEPPARIELAASSLRNWRSTAELQGHILD